MVVKKTAKAEKKKPSKQKASPKGKTKGKPQGKRGKKSEQLSEDAAIVIVDDDFQIDKEKENEERRAYLEEARSQEAFD